MAVGSKESHVPIALHSRLTRSVTSDVLPDSNPDTLSDDVARQSVDQLASNVVRVGVQRSDDMMTMMMMIGFSDCRWTPARVADDVTTLVIDSHHCSAARYR